MAKTYYQNQHTYTVSTPTGTGTNIDVPSGFCVTDETGLFYKDFYQLTAVAANVVTATNLVYNFSPIHFATLNPATGQLPVTQSPSTSGFSGYSGFSSYSGFSGFSSYSGVSGYSGANPGASGYSGKSGYSGISGFSGQNNATSGTPTASTSGYSGQIVYDTNYMYICVDGVSGWKRAGII